MPCYTPPHQGCPHQDDIIENKKCDIIGHINSLCERLKYYEEKSDTATNLLCDLLKTHIIANPSPELVRWWNEHKKWDETR